MIDDLIVGQAGWRKITADSVTLTVGTSVSNVSDLQTAHDGNFYHLVEVAATPGIDLIVDFVSVDRFSWVSLIDVYSGSAIHALAIQLYNWDNTTWDTFGASQNGASDLVTPGGYILNNHDFLVPSDDDYIGTDANAGRTRVRYYHTMMGNASHDLDIDVVALYK